MENWILLAVGFIIALFSSMIGIGGGLLWAPFFILIKGYDFRLAILISFTVQLIGMGSATVSNVRIKSIHWKLSLGLLPLISFGVITGVLLNRQIPNPHLLEMGLGVLSIIESLFFTFQAEKYNEKKSVDLTLKSPLWLKAQGTLFSFFSGIFSIGISDFIIPVFRGKLKIPMQNAIGTSIFLNFYIALIGTGLSFFVKDFSLPEDILSILIFSWIGVVIGGQIGPRVSKYIDDNRLKEIFIFVLLLLGIHLIYQSVDF
jgi:hypothetical protein